MAPFSVAQLKETASNVRTSGSDKFQSVRAKYTSRSSAESSYNHQDPSTKAPPPPQRADGHDESTSALPSRARPGPPPPVRRSTRPDVQMNRPSLPAGNESASEVINWTSLSRNDKDVFFGWLDEFFTTKKTSLSGIGQKRPPARAMIVNGGNSSRLEDLEMSHPPRSENGSAAQDLCTFFSSTTHWATPWFSSQNPTPPPLECITDCMRTHSIQWHGDTHTLSGGVLFGDLSACWYTVEWSQRNVRNTTSALRRAAFIPIPDALSQNELVAAHETYGETVAAFAEGYEDTGQWCARGECWDLANEALKSFEQWDYVPKPVPCIGTTHGHLIYEGKAWGNADTQQAGRWRGGDDRIRRGDIIQWKSAAIKEGYTKFTLGQPDHTAIIVCDQQPLSNPGNGRAMRPAELGQLEVVEQSVHSPPARKVYQLKGLEAGELWIYRPVGMEAYLKIIFSEKWPEGLQASTT